MYLDQADLVEDQLRLLRQRLFPAEPAQNSLSASDVQRQTAAARATGIELPLIDLFEAVGLSATEVQVLWLLVAHELCPIVRRGLRELATEQVPDVTIDVVRRLVYGERPSADAWSELAEDGALRRWNLVVMPAAEPGASYRRVISVAPRVLALAHGLRALDGEIAELVSAGRVADLEALEVDEAAVRAAREALGRDRGLVIVAGAPGTGRRSLLVASARAQQRAVLEIDPRKLSTDARELREQLRAIRRECRLFRCIPLFRDLDALTSSHEVDRIGLLETELPELVLATARQPIRRRWSSPPATIELGALTSVQRARLWAGAIAMASSGDAEVMATLYPLAPALIHVAGRAALRQCGDGELQAAHIADGVRSVLDDRLAGLATRLHVTQSWDDLVLPADQTTAIIELLARIRERGRVYEDWGFAEKVGKGLGVSALLSGPPGTSKSMAAGLIGRDLGVEVYQVDLSKIVSKYIGETEKNLSALFDAAEAGHAILLFDEADALFGKRTDVKSSNDRHANQEVNYLLQRMESFRGICILTTNHEAALDEAFRRRLSVHVRFALPEIDERKRLWQAMIPSKAPIAGAVSFDGLAQRFVMSGGHIRNAVMRAAFLAADEQTSIHPAHFARAAQLEYEAMGKVSTNL